MRRTDPLNARQVEVLRWIADGHPADQAGSGPFKRTAAALQDRRLARISRPGGAWSATLTDEGRHYLKHGRHADGNDKPAPRRAARRVAPVRKEPGPTSTRPITGVSTAPDPRQHRPTSVRRSPAEQLVADVVAAGGSLDLERSYAGRDRVSELVRNANRHGKVPTGSRLTHSYVHIDDGSYLGTSINRVVLEDGPAGTDASLIDVPVPEHIVRYHRALATLRKNGGPGVSSGQRTRALRLLQAVALEAERRGHTVSAPRTQDRSDHRRAQDVWHLVVTVDDHAVPLRISEERERIEHVPTTRELTEQARRSWTRIPTHDTVPSGRLRIDLGAEDSSDRKSSWADRASWRLEDKLPELLREIAVRADEIRIRSAERDRAQAIYERAVEAERRRAYERIEEDHRVEILQQRLADWRTAQELREYLADRTAAVEKAAGGADVDAADLVDPREWLAWVAEHIEQLDPRDGLQSPPQPRRIPDHELQKYMRFVMPPKGLHYREIEY